MIKQHFAGGSTGQDLLEAVKRLSIAEDTLDAVASQIRARRRSAVYPDERFAPVYGDTFVQAAANGEDR